MREGGEGDRQVQSTGVRGGSTQAVATTTVRGTAKKKRTKKAARWYRDPRDASRFEQRVLAAEVDLRRAAGELAGLAGCIAGSTIDLNPHQVKAAVFALDSLDRGGAILADEVGLGKTVEAGLVLRQLWSEGRRRILVLAPAPLRRQWQHELQTKFHLPSAIRDSRECKRLARQGEAPWNAPGILLCSIPFAYNRRDELAAVDWDLVVIDEAHRLRNVARGSSKQAAGIRDALEGRPKLMLTATPFQNDLVELYGLVSFVDPTLLGTDYSFQVRYREAADDEASQEDILADLRDRLGSVVNRTLRKEVSSYLQFTERHSTLVHFRSTDAEESLRQDVTNYIADENSVVFQGPRRALMALVYHKLLASSSHALASSLDRLVLTLEKARKDAQAIAGFDAIFDQFDGAFDEEEESGGGTARRTADADPAAIEREIATVKQLADRARRIRKNAKASALLKALDKTFTTARERGEPDKAVVFTESRLTQSYLHEVLTREGYQVVLFNGTNNDPDSQACYEQWLAEDPDRRQLPREIGVREAIVQRFRDSAHVFLATEAAAEGLNLQFCNLLVNYDLPWNPQRVEQRIGRCHRYGQKHDVLVVNLVDERNPVDLRVHELLEKKFSLFDGVFGASDTPLGEVMDGCEVERAIVDILQRCRTAVEIKGAFDRLESRLDEAAHRQADVRKEILDNFHPELAGHLLGLEEQTRAQVDTLNRRLARTLTSVCSPAKKDRLSEGIFRLEALPAELGDALPEVEPGLFAVGTRRRDPSIRCESLTLEHPLTQHVLADRRAALPEDLEHFSLWAPSRRAFRLAGLPEEGIGWWECVRLDIGGDRPRQEILHLVTVRRGGTWELVDQEVVQEMLTWETGAWEPEGTAEPPSNALELMDEARTTHLAQLANEVRQQGIDRLHQEFARADRFAGEQLMEVEDKLAQVRAEMPVLRAEVEDARRAGDLAAVESACRLLDRLEDRLVHLRRERIRLEDEQLAAGEKLRRERRAALATQPRAERVVLGCFRLAD